MFLNCCTFEKFIKIIMFDCFSVQFVPPFFNPSETFKMPKNSKKRTNMDINFVILNHATGQTRYHTRRITYSRADRLRGDTCTYVCPRLGLIKPGQTYVCSKLWVFSIKITLWLILLFFLRIVVWSVLSCGLFQNFLSPLVVSRLFQ